MWEYVIGIIIGLAIMNCMSFVLMRVRWRETSKLSGEFVQQIGNHASKTMDYFIAGNLNQPEAAFEFMRSEFGENFTYVNYSTHGWSAFDTVEKIATDIIEHSYQARIFTISVGDHVARYLEHYGTRDIKIYAINPCSNHTTLRRPLSLLLVMGAPLLGLLCCGLGWLSIIPVIPTVGGEYSLMLLADQYMTIAYDLPPRAAAKTVGVICSKNDELLRNEIIRQFFGSAKIVEIDTTHGDTVGAGSKYLQGMQELLDAPT